jgi:hypothetical protein
MRLPQNSRSVALAYVGKLADSHTSALPRPMATACLLPALDDCVKAEHVALTVH